MTEEEAMRVARGLTTLFEVRRVMESGGWMTGPHLRFRSHEEAQAVASQMQDAVRAKGVFVDVVEVQP